MILFQIFILNLNLLGERYIEAYGEVPICDCGKCVCNVNGRNKNREEKLKVKKFLMGINDEFR